MPVINEPVKSRKNNDAPIKNNNVLKAEAKSNPFAPIVFSFQRYEVLL